ncbi:hypothetical protein [Tautonia marina]|uniref:hypothetical protein n=1 Tax=Tautonia marina TaxID=2653855 RepID=UPI0012613A38|nr:hypothetical protein [Tautonia marina]
MSEIAFENCDTFGCHESQELLVATEGVHQRLDEISRLGRTPFQNFGNRLTSFSSLFFSRSSFMKIDRRLEGAVQINIFASVEPCFVAC